MTRAPASELLVVNDVTRLAQRRAADPRASAWVSANAGAGKTKVLSDRVLRLLLTGAPPGRILCLTFTKAAAANMAIRVFERLAQWVTLDEQSLGDELAELEGSRPSPDHLRQARRLFARAVETPGGLKIETIHAFCERLLHLVPFEANVPARFSVLDEAQVGEQIAQATKEVLSEAASEASPELADAFARIGLDAAGERLTEVVAAAVKAIKCERLPADLATCTARLRTTLGLAAHETAAAIEQDMIGLSREELGGIAGALRATSSSQDRDLAEAIASFLASREPGRAAAALSLHLLHRGRRRHAAGAARDESRPAVDQRRARERARAPRRGLREAQGRRRGRAHERALYARGRDREAG